MFESCLKKQELIIKEFNLCINQEDRYRRLISLGKEQDCLLPEMKDDHHLVPGCQSRMYLHSTFKDGLVFFQAESDALISAGLAVLLMRVYSGETPETILKCPPTYLEVLGINTSLTPSRANGLSNIMLRMKQEALKYLMASTKP
ncbi:MAG: SufE family protein [Parachlamydiales bacterium]|nr:SufE family protein [Parachlamydiales bacterium]